MLSFFPTPLPDELLYSLCGRWTRLSAIESPKAAAEQLFGTPYAIAFVDLPCRLGGLVKSLPFYSARELAERWTLLPYYLAFQQSDSRENAYTLALGHSTALHLLLGVTAFRVMSARSLRFCPTCLDEMEARWGTLYWRRMHQLPGVLVCSAHREALRDSLVVRATANRHQFVVCDRAVCPRDAPPILDAPPNDALIDIAMRSSAYLNEPPCSDVDNLSANYRNRLDVCGLMRSPAKVDLVATFDCFESFLEGFPHEFRRLIPSNPEIWLPRLFRKNRTASLPLFHALFQSFLDNAASGLRTKTARCRADDHDHVLVGRTSKDRVNWSLLDQSYARQLRAAATQLRALAPPRRLTLTSMEQAMSRRDWLLKRCSKMPKSVAAASSLTESVEHFQHRRARWCAERLEADPNLDFWVILREAGLKHRMADLVRLYRRSITKAA